MRQLMLLICFSAFMNACNNKNSSGKILDKTQMQSVLTDIIKAESFSDVYIRKDTHTDVEKENAVLQKEIFAIHHITKEDFYTSYDYYKNHPEIMQVILDSIIAKANASKTPLNHPKVNPRLNLFHPNK